MPARVTPKNSAPLVEVFSSTQGEGPLVGCRQIFVRFAGCNLACAYCDTDHDEPRSCRIETSPGSQEFNRIENPIPLATVVELIRRWKALSPGLHHSISLTGGEPLQSDDILAHWLPELKRELPIYLETNGTLPTALARLLSDIDLVSVDIKLQSVTGFETPWDRHREFLDTAGDKACCVKVVVDSYTRDEEVATAALLVEETVPGTPLVVQPSTRDAKLAITSGRLLQIQAVAAAIHSDTRVIPQTHRFLDLL